MTVTESPFVCLVSLCGIEEEAFTVRMFFNIWKDIMLCLLFVVQMISLFKNITLLMSIIIWNRNWMLNGSWVWIPTVIITRIVNNVQLSSVNWVPEFPCRYVARSHLLGGRVRNAVDLDSAESWLDRPRHTVALVTSYQVTLKTSPPRLGYQQWWEASLPDELFNGYVIELVTQGRDVDNGQSNHTNNYWTNQIID